MSTVQKPTIGRQVHYSLTERDAEQINRRRDDWAHFRANVVNLPEQGYQAHVGNKVERGQVFPATIVRVSNSSDHVNLRVLLDGTDDLWATSVQIGDDLNEGAAIWPPRV